MSESLALQLLHDADNKLDKRISKVEEEVEAIPALAQKVEQNTAAMTRMTTAIYSVGVIVVGAASSVVVLGPS